MCLHVIVALIEKLAAAIISVYMWSLPVPCSSWVDAALPAIGASLTKPPGERKASIKSRGSTEVAFGRGDLSDCPPRGLRRGPGVSCFRSEGCPPGSAEGEQENASEPAYIHIYIYIYIYMFIYTHIHAYTCVCIYIYIYTYMGYTCYNRYVCICVCIHIHIYVYTYTHVIHTIMNT